MKSPANARSFGLCALASAVALVGMMAVGTPAAAATCTPQGQSYKIIKVKKASLAHLTGKLAYKEGGSKICVDGEVRKRRDVMMEPTNAPTEVCANAGAKGTGYQVGAGLGAGSCN